MIVNITNIYNNTIQYSMLNFFWFFIRIRRRCVAMRQKLKIKWPSRKKLDACEERNSLLLGLYKFRLYKFRLFFVREDWTCYWTCLGRLTIGACPLKFAWLKKLLEVFKLCTMKYTYIYIHKIILLCCEIWMQVLHLVCFQWIWFCADLLFLEKN